MQFMLGIIIGIFLTIGTAYVLDSGHAAVCPAGGVGCPIVNWDEADVRFTHLKEGVDHLKDGLDSAWNHLVRH
jgi:hypothetical protein